MAKATLIKAGLSDRGDMRLYKLSPPLRHESWDDTVTEHEYVVVSAVVSAGDTGMAETYIFPGNEAGEVTGWGEIGASQRGTTDHEKVLRESGFDQIDNDTIKQKG